MWDEPSDGTFLITGDNRYRHEIAKFLAEVPTERLNEAYVDYLDFELKESVDDIHGYQSLYYEMLKKFKPATLDLNHNSSEFHKEILEMCDAVAREIARRAIS